VTFGSNHRSSISKRVHAIAQMTWRLGRAAFGRMLQRSIVLTFMLASTFAQAQSVHLEELTWTELRDRIAAGSTTVLVPIGGTEQSGPHMVLGKHNVRARALAAEIAARLGNAVVAPVISYVPEGSIKPPSGHMRFTGTISIPESTFESVLEGAARSFRQHGFRDVVFLGDHGGYQMAEQRVADRLNREWGSDKCCRVHALLAYYEAAEGSQGAFVNALRQKGYSNAEIGRHAGLADTALSMAVDPSLVRHGALSTAARRGAADGVDGDPARATAALGQLGVNAVIDASVSAIQSATRR
jgi:creatinine amidohydrolase